MPEIVGDLVVQITGDYSKLDADIQQAAQVAASGAGTIASSFGSAATAVDTFEQRIGALVESGHTLAEALEKVSAQDLSASFAATGNAAAQAAQQIDLFDEAIQVPYADAAGQLNMFTTALEPIQGAAQGAATSLEKLTTGVPPPPMVQGATDAFDGLGSTLLGFAGIALTAQGAFAILKEAFGQFELIEQTSVAFEHLTGSASAAAAMIADAKTVALNFQAPFEGVLQAEKRFTSFGVEVEKIPGLLRTAADAAAATGTGFDSIASSMERMIESGNVATRSLVQLGLNISDLATVMGVADADVKEAFKDLDQSERISVMEQALQKFSGTAEAMDQTVSGAFSDLSLQAKFALGEVGQAMAPAIVYFTKIQEAAIESVSIIAKAFIDLETTIGTFASVLKETIKPFADIPGLADAAARGMSSFKDALPTLALSAINPALSAFKSTLELLIPIWEVVSGKVAGQTEMFDALGKTMTKLATDASKSGDDFKKAWSDSQIAAGVGNVGSAINNVVKAQEAANQKFAEAQATFDRINDSYTNGTKLSNGYVATLADVQRAQGLVNAAYNEANAGALAAAKGQEEAAKQAKALMDEEIKLAPAFGTVSRGVQDLDLDLGNLDEVMDQIAEKNATDKLVQNFKTGTAEIKKQLADAEKAARDFSAFMSGGFDLMADKVDASMKKLATSMAPGPIKLMFDPITKGLLEVDSKTKDVNDTMGRFIQQMVFTAETSGGLQQSVMQQNDAWKRLGAEGLEHALTNLQEVTAAYNTLTKDSKTDLDIMLANTESMTSQQKQLWVDTAQKIIAEWKILGKEVPDAAAQGLEAAKAAIQNASMDIVGAYKALGVQSLQAVQESADKMALAYDKVSKDATASANTQLAAWVAMENAKVIAAQAAGQTIGVSEAAAIELAKMKLEDLKNTWGTAFTTIAKGVGDAFGGMVKTMGDQLMAGKVNVTQILSDLGKAIVDVFLNVAAKAVSRFVTEQLLGELAGGLFSTGESAAAMGKSVAGTFSTIAQSTEKVGQGIAGSLGGIMSSVGSIANVVTGIVQAISGIVGNIQQAHANKLLGEIEVSTRYAQIILANMANNDINNNAIIQGKIGDAANFIAGAVDSSVGTESDISRQILQQVGLINNHVLDLHGDLVNILMTLNGGIQVSNTIAANIDENTAATNDGNGSLDEISGSSASASATLNGLSTSTVQGFSSMTQLAGATNAGIGVLQGMTGEANGVLTDAAGQITNAGDAMVGAGDELTSAGQVMAGSALAMGAAIGSFTPALASFMQVTALTQSSLPTTSGPPGSFQASLPSLTGSIPGTELASTPGSFSQMPTVKTDFGVSAGSAQGSITEKPTGWTDEQWAAYKSGGSQGLMGLANAPKPTAPAPVDQTIDASKQQWFGGMGPNTPYISPTAIPTASGNGVMSLAEIQAALGIKPAAAATEAAGQSPADMQANLEAAGKTTADNLAANKIQENIAAAGKTTADNLAANQAQEAAPGQMSQDQIQANLVAAGRTVADNLAAAGKTPEDNVAAAGRTVADNLAKSLGVISTGETSSIGTAPTLGGISSSTTSTGGSDLMQLAQIGAQQLTVQQNILQAILSKTGSTNSPETGNIYSAGIGGVPSSKQVHVTINNPQVSNQSDIDKMVAQIQNAGMSQN